MRFNVDDKVILKDNITIDEINKNSGALISSIDKLIEISKSTGLTIWRVSENFERVGNEYIFRYAEISFIGVNGDYKSHIFQKIQ